MSPTRRKDDGLERVWKALASEVRRDMLDALFDGPKSTGELALLFPDLSRFAVMQHLRVLIRAKLVLSKKTGRVRTNTLNAVPIQMIYERWVSKYAAPWAGMLTAMKDSIEGPAKPSRARKSPTERATDPRVSRLFGAESERS
ncbi:MAG: ArsR/SmtB family transcription factor [Phycisphaerales bacterium]